MTIIAISMQTRRPSLPIQVLLKITTVEIIQATRPFTNNKSLRAYGFPLEWHKPYVEQWPPICNLYSLETRNLTMLYARSTSCLIYSETKEGFKIMLFIEADSATECKFQDINQSVFSNNIECHLLCSLQWSSWIYPSDVYWHKRFTHLQMEHINLDYRVMLSLDIEKVFDSVDWDCIREVLEYMSFALIFLWWISIPYATLRAAVKIRITLTLFWYPSRNKNL